MFSRFIFAFLVGAGSSWAHGEEASSAESAEPLSADSAGEAGVSSIESATQMVLDVDPLISTTLGPEGMAAFSISTGALVVTGISLYVWSDRARAVELYQRAAAEAKTRLASGKADVLGSPDGPLARVAQVERKTIECKRPDIKSLSDAQVAALIVVRASSLQFKK